MKVLITDYEYVNIEQEEALVAKLGAELIDLNKRQDLTLQQAVKDADAIIVQYANITREVIAEMTCCKMIIKYGIGVNNIDQVAASEKGIYVCNVPDYGVDEVSNHAIAMIMSLQRKLPLISRILSEGRWSYEPLIPIKRLEGSTLGLLGFGRIPQLLAQKMGNFGMRILTYDPFIGADIAQDLGVQLVDFATLIRESDILSLHCALNDNTKHLINAGVLQQMKPNAIIVNTARGPVIDEQALVEALENGTIAAAGLDTFEQEPIAKDNKLLFMNNVICTPHSAWYSEEAIRAVQRKAAEEVVNILAGNKPFNALNRAKVG